MPRLLNTFAGRASPSPCLPCRRQDHRLRRPRSMATSSNKPYSRVSKKGYKVEYKEFLDYVQPNLALANGALDANLFQHSLYLENSRPTRGSSSPA